MLDALREYLQRNANAFMVQTMQDRIQSFLALLPEAEAAHLIGMGWAYVIVAEANRPGLQPYVPELAA